MHVPDGFLDAPTSVATGGRRRGRASALALRGARRELDDRTAPMAGLVATFVFAAQMINFPVGAGTSGHLLGGALAAVLVGPVDRPCCAVAWCCSCRRLLFADGGITALGTNITLMGLVAVVVGWLVFLACARPCCPSGSSMVAPGSGRRRPGLACRSRRWSSPSSSPSGAGRRPARPRSPPRCSAGTSLIGIGEAVDHRPGRRQRRRRAPRPGPRRPPASWPSRELEIRDGR